MKAFLKGFLSYPKPERNGIIVLLLLIICLAAIKYFLPYWIRPDVKSDFATYQRDIAAFESDTVIELNNATADDFARLKGIGPTLAANIVAYREELGGFVKKEQLNEAKGIGDAKYAAVENYVRLDGVKVTLIRINYLPEEELAAHPYIGKGIAKAIVKRRAKKGLFKKVAELKELKLMREEKYSRLKPYVSLK
jgi:competence protein ComEA